MIKPCSSMAVAGPFWAPRVSLLWSARHSKPLFDYVSVESGRPISQCTHSVLNMGCSTLGLNQAEGAASGPKLSDRDAICPWFTPTIDLSVICHWLRWSFGISFYGHRIGCTKVMHQWQGGSWSTIQVLSAFIVMPCNEATTWVVYVVYQVTFISQCLALADRPFFLICLHYPRYSRLDLVLVRPTVWLLSFRISLKGLRYQPYFCLFTELASLLYWLSGSSWTALRLFSLEWRGQAKEDSKICPRSAYKNTTLSYMYKKLKIRLYLPRYDMQ